MDNDWLQFGSRLMVYGRVTWLDVMLMENTHTHTHTHRLQYGSKLMVCVGVRRLDVMLMENTRTESVGVLGLCAGFECGFIGPGLGLSTGLERECVGTVCRV